MILVIDNFDSFVYNLARYIENVGHDTIVVRNNTISVQQVYELNPSHIVVSPGPGTPAEAGMSLDIVSNFYDKCPILGVCLGHQIIGQSFGANVSFAKVPMHGKESIIYHYNSSIFLGIPNSIKVGRYHSLIVENINSNLDIRAIAVSAEAEVMAIEHIRYPVFGVQFHPESILTDCGLDIIRNFVAL